ncbi:MAG: hypothetical protein EBR02_07795 [Alphaproteobacteria bacterium]|nr:hypothetical protein [Alphaproteobacteria bacterium]
MFPNPTLQPSLRWAMHWLAKPVMLHIILPYLMLLIVIGTVAQKYIGLYDSQKIFFSSFVLWVGVFPLPGGRAVTALMLLSLLAKLIVASPWRKQTSGIFIAHLGVALLLVGGLVTAASSKEGYVALAPGESTSHFSDYHQRVLTVHKNKELLWQTPLVDIKKNALLTDARLPFSLQVNDICRNCTMAMQEQKDPARKGVAQKVHLSALAPHMEDERNFSGIEISLSGAGKDSDGIYVLFEPMEKQPEVKRGADNYAIRLGRESYALPFSLQLLEAKKEVHPGTEMARSFRSKVMINDGKLNQQAVITMNHPLRYKGYTVYQASFNGDAQTEETKSVSFAIVQNSGRVFPYVASATLCIGLLIHLFFRLPPLMTRRPHAA